MLNTLVKIQDSLLEKKIMALNELVEFNEEFHNVKQMYYQGETFIEELYDYYSCIYQKFNEDDYNKFKKILLFGNIFSSKIKEKFNLINCDLYNIIDIKNKEYSLEKEDMPKNANKLIKTVNERIIEVIDLIREDLHLNNSYIHDFIEKYKQL